MGAVSNCQPVTIVVMERCCCCTVKTGSIVLGALMLVGSVMTIGRSANDILSGDSQVDERELYDYGMSSIHVQRFKTIFYYLSLTNVVLSFITIIISSLLIYGVNKENPKLIKPMVVFLPLDSAIRLIFVCLICINFGLLSPASLAVNFVWFFVMILNILIWLCIYSHYQQLNEGSNGYSGN